MYGTYWDVRKGLIPMVGGGRAAGTSVLIEAVACEVDSLAPMPKLVKKASPPPSANAQLRSSMDKLPAKLTGTTPPTSTIGAAAYVGAPHAEHNARGTIHQQQYNSASLRQPGC